MDILYDEISKEISVENYCFENLISAFDSKDLNCKYYECLCNSKQPRRKRKLLQKRTYKILEARKNTSLKKYKTRSSTYIPHALQTKEKVQKRNTRERTRVQAVNLEFKRLRWLLPVSNRGKRISKENILKYAILYINALRDMIRKHDIKAISGKKTC